MNKLVLAAASMNAVIATASFACGFHNYTPQPSFTDRVRSSDHVVLARPDETNPFRYKVVEDLIGGGKGVDIPYLVDSSARRKFASDSTAAMLFIKGAGDDAWVHSIYVDSATEPVVRHVVQNLTAWSQPLDTERFKFFATLADHPNDTVHQVALRELDQAPYNLLHTLPLAINPARLTASLGDPAQQSLTPIRILLLGINGNKSLTERFADGLDRQIRTEGSILGAYATALIEMEGVEAIDKRIVPYLQDPHVSLLSREILIEAMSMHARSGDPAVEEAIVWGVRQALAQEPRLIQAVVRSFGWRAKLTK